MSTKALRITGGCLLGCALLAYWMWHNTFNRIAHVEQDFILQNGQTALLAFTPVLEGAPYSVSLTYKAQKNPLIVMQFSRLILNGRFLGLARI
jgi:hypothetical protein